MTSLTAAFVDIATCLSPTLKNLQLMSPEATRSSSSALTSKAPTHSWRFAEITAQPQFQDHFRSSQARPAHSRNKGVTVGCTMTHSRRYLHHHRRQQVPQQAETPVTVVDAAGVPTHLGNSMISLRQPDYSVHRQTNTINFNH